MPESDRQSRMAAIPALMPAADPITGAMIANTTPELNGMRIPNDTSDTVNVGTFPAFPGWPNAATPVLPGENFNLAFPTSDFELSEQSVSVNFEQSPWNRVYDTEVRFSQHFFVWRDGLPLDGNYESKIGVTLPQLNEILRTQYAAYMELINAAGDPDSRLDPTLVQLANEIHRQGELSYHHIPGLKENIKHKVTYETLGYCFPQYIADRWRYTGVVIYNNLNPYTTANTITLCVSGIAKQLPENVWGRVYKLQKLFFVVMRHFDETLNKYTYFEVRPEVRDEQYVVPQDKMYMDSAGHVRYGYSILVGTVRDDPRNYPAPDVCRKMAGLSVTSTEAFRFTRYKNYGLDIALETSVPMRNPYACVWG